MNITTKSGTVFELDDERGLVSYRKGSHKGCHHISHYKRRGELSEGVDARAAEWERNNNGKQIAWVCLPVIICTDETELCACVGLLKQADEVRIARQQEAEDQRNREHRAAREQAIASCPEGCEPAEHKTSYDGIVTYAAVSDGAECQAWDDTYVHVGGGVYHIPTERFVDDRERKGRESQRKEHAEQAEQEHYENKLAEAKATGKRVKLRGWVTDRCMKGDDENCSFDNATEWVTPEGELVTTYSCCY
jgi:hypothetical protein